LNNQNVNLIREAQKNEKKAWIKNISRVLSCTCDYFWLYGMIGMVYAGYKLKRQQIKTKEERENVERERF